MTPHPVAGDVVSRLLPTGSTVAAAESLTGGLVCAALTSVPGSSAVVRGGVVSYAYDVKSGLLGVNASLLSTRGAVNADVAEQMAAGVRRVCGASIGLATTGVAGPDRADGEPVGTVFIACDAGDRAAVRRLSLTGDREQIRRDSVDAVLRLLLEVLDGAGTRSGLRALP